MKNKLAVLACLMTLSFVVACATETSPGASEWCLKYDTVACRDDDMDCLSNEAEYVCKCEKESQPALYQELCE